MRCVSPASPGIATYVSRESSERNRELLEMNVRGGLRRQLASLSD